MGQTSVRCCGLNISECISVNVFKRHLQRLISSKMFFYKQLVCLSPIGSIMLMDMFKAILFTDSGAAEPDELLPQILDSRLRTRVH